MSNRPETGLTSRLPGPPPLGLTSTRSIRDSMRDLMEASRDEPQAEVEADDSRQNRLIIVLADISGYTELMVANQTAAMHGQMMVSLLIESILKQVDIPLRLQEIEGDAVFLYAEHPGADAQWKEVCAEVGAKLSQFFDAFAEAVIELEESTICRCAVCQTEDLLRLKIVVHAGEAVFHSIQGRAQVSGVDVIKAHRLLKNSVPSHEYILLTEAAHEHLAPSLDLAFVEGEERYDQLGSIKTFIHFPGDHEEIRQRFYAQSAAQIAWRGVHYAGWGLVEEFKALFRQIRRPVAPVSPFRRVAYVTFLVLIAPLVLLALATSTPIRLLLRRANQS